MLSSHLRLGKQHCTLGKEKVIPVLKYAPRYEDVSLTYLRTKPRRFIGRVEV